jgi:hypothetical protein
MTDKKVLAEYKCGCTWVGLRSECLEYCAIHGDDRRRLYHCTFEASETDGWSCKAPEGEQGR